MRVAWVAGHSLGDTGGAEMSDAAFIERAPDGVSVEWWRKVPHLDGYDRVVCSRPDMLSREDADRLAEAAPVILAHGYMRNVAPGCQELFEASRLFVAVSPRHLAAEREWLGCRTWAATFNWFPTHDLAPAPKEPFALWPHRLAGHKDIEKGRAWAEGHGVELVEMHDKPLAVVHEAMTRASWVVLFSKDVVEPGNRAVQEGYIAGCEPVIDHNVWSLSWEMTPAEMREAVDASPAWFWALVRDT